MWIWNGWKGVQVDIVLAGRLISWLVYIAPMRDKVLLGLDFLQAADAIIHARGGLWVGDTLVPTRAQPGCRVGIQKISGDPQVDRSQRWIVVSDDDPDLPKDGSQRWVVLSDDDPAVRVAKISLSTGHARSMFIGATEGLATSTSFSHGTAVPPAPFPFEENGASLVREEPPAWQPMSEEALGLMAGFPLTPVTHTVTSVSGSMPAQI